jgi:hypothetical protein
MIAKAREKTNTFMMGLRQPLERIELRNVIGVRHAPPAMAFFRESAPYPDLHAVEVQVADLQCAAP